MRTQEIGAVIDTAASALTRLLAPVTTPAIDSRPGSGPGQWLTSDGWRVLARPRPDDGRGDVVQSFTLPDGATACARIDADRRVSVPFDVNEAYLNYVHEHWRLSHEPRALSERQLRLFYGIKRLIPRSLQLRARRLLVRVQQYPEFPTWPLDESVARLLRFYARCLMLADGSDELEFRWFWPGRHSAAVVLTHDVESAAGLRLGLELADLEEERGLRSSFNVVADWYPIDWGIVRELSERGFEIGLHGIYHDRSLFSSRSEFESQQPRLRDAAAKLGAVGFRSPATHRVIDWLAELPVSYDCSVPHSDPFEPQPGGCCSLWPFFVGDVVELPYTLPQDHTLLTLLGKTSIELWETQLDRIEQLNGLAQMLTHPDPGYLGDPLKRALYVEFLELLHERPQLWMPLPRDVAAWWRRRDRGDGEIQLGVARLDGEVTFEPPVRPGADRTKD